MKVSFLKNLNFHLFFKKMWILKMIKLLNILFRLFWVFKNSINKILFIESKFLILFYKFFLNIKTKFLNDYLKS